MGTLGGDAQAKFGRFSAAYNAAHIEFIRRCYGEAWIVMSLKNAWHKLTNRLPADGDKLPSNARLSLYSNALGVRSNTQNTCSPVFNCYKPHAGKTATDF